jgi:hypothetical protein
VGAELSRVHVRPMLSADALESNDDSEQIEHIREGFRTFRVQAADCYCADKPLLLGAIETGFASLEEFNQLCSKAMVRAVDTSMGRRPSSLGLADPADTANDKGSQSVEMKPWNQPVRV